MKLKVLFVLGMAAGIAMGQGPGAFARPAGPGARGGGFGGPGGGEFGGPVVTGAPFSAVEVTTRQQQLADGNAINNTNRVVLYRDGQGRTRTETTIPADAATGRAARTMITIHDPVGRQTITLDSATMTARTMKMPGPPPSAGNGSGGNSQARPGRGPNPNSSNRTAPPTRTGRGGSSINSEVLGTRMINNAAANGTRETEVIAAGKIGNSQPITVVRETWYSAELKRNISVSVTDPQRGNSKTELTNIVQGEPSADLFTVPSGYTTQNPSRGNGRGPGGPGAAGAFRPRPAF